MSGQTQHWLVKTSNLPHKSPMSGANLQACNSFSIIDLPVYMIVLDVSHSARVIDFARRILDKDPQFCLRQTGVLISIHTFLQSVLFMCLSYLN